MAARRSSGRPVTDSRARCSTAPRVSRSVSVHSTVVVSASARDRRLAASARRSAWRRRSLACAPSRPSCGVSSPPAVGFESRARVVEQGALGPPVGDRLEQGHQHCGLAAGQPVLLDRRGDLGLVAARQPRHLPRHRWHDQPDSDVVLDLVAQTLDQGQPPADPALVPLEELADLGLGQAELPDQLADHQRLLEVHQPAATPIQAVHRRHRRPGSQRQCPHRQRREPQASSRGQPLEPIDQHQRPLGTGVSRRHHRRDLPEPPHRRRHGGLSPRLRDPRRSARPARRSE